MNDLFTALIGQACLLAVDTSSVTTWVTCICSAVIAIATCGIQVYRMWRDRDDDETKDEDAKDSEDDGKE